jgi:hypothetical protein
MKFEWEKLDEGTVRAKVFGGWVLYVYDISRSSGEETVSSLAFIPDLKHEWIID